MGVLRNGDKADTAAGTTWLVSPLAAPLLCQFGVHNTPVDDMGSQHTLTLVQAGGAHVRNHRSAAAPGV